MVTIGRFVYLVMFLVFLATWVIILLPLTMTNHPTYQKDYMVIMHRSKRRGTPEKSP
jgi:hypothetical protein